MDGASFWSVLTRPSVFSYAAKAFILILLFPSGLNLWSETKCVCVPVMFLIVQGQNLLVLVLAQIAKVTKKSSTFHAVL